MQRILITGASGFIGSHLVRVAQSLGYEVWAAIRPESNRRKLESQGVRLVEVDYSDEHHLTEMLRAVIPPTLGQEPMWHYVIHNAGITKTAHTEEFQEVNAEQTRRLLSALGALPTPPLRFVLMSSMSSYGDSNGPTAPLRAEDEQHPHTLYGRSKCLAEHYTEQSGLPFTLLMPTGVYGPGDADYLLSLQGIARGINAMAGCKTQYLTFVYGEDVARGRGQAVYRRRRGHLYRPRVRPYGAAPHRAQARPTYPHPPACGTSRLCLWFAEGTPHG